MNNLAEYLAGTNPNDITSLLELTDALTTPAAPGKFIVRWQSATGRVYTKSERLVGPALVAGRERTGKAKRKTARRQAAALREAERR